MSKQQEKDNLFAQIRNLHAVKNVSASGGKEDGYCLDSLELGPLIATGCNAAVYAARHLNSNDDTDDDISILSEPVDDQVNTDPEDGDRNPSNVKMSTAESDEASRTNLDVEEPATKINSDWDESEVSLVDLEESDSEVSLLDVEESDSEVSLMDMEESDSEVSLLDWESDMEESCGEEPLVLQVNLLPRESVGDTLTQEQAGVIDPPALPDHDLAVKMMFNYDIESNAEAVSRAMVNEVVPLCLAAGIQERSIWHNGNHVKKKALPPHPNIVWMYDTFVDSMPDLPDNTVHYPAALPTRLYNNGLGRNKTMFLVMKRYTCTLTDYLAREKPSMAARCLILCQLLEGVVFLNQQGIAHRDLKSDNLLLDLSAGPDNPVLVISDFGCCLWEGSLQLPYVTSQTCKGGNSALMAPEIACAEAGPRSVLDYSKSDLWAVGALTYEIFGQDNPFYHSSRSSRHPSCHLDSRSYREEQLPLLPDATPTVIKNLARNMLSRDSNKRVSAEVAATVMQLYLWGPSDWTSRLGRSNPVNINTLQDWTVSLAAQLACQRSHTYTSVGNMVKQIYLSRVSYDDLKGAQILLQTSY